MLRRQRLDRSRSAHTYPSYRALAPPGSGGLFLAVVVSGDSWSRRLSLAPSAVEGQRGARIREEHAQSLSPAGRWLDAQGAVHAMASDLAVVVEDPILNAGAPSSVSDLPGPLVDDHAVG